MEPENRTSKLASLIAELTTSEDTAVALIREIWNACPEDKKREVATALANKILARVSTSDDHQSRTLLENGLKEIGLKVARELLEERSAEAREKMTPKIVAHFDVAMEQAIDKAKKGLEASIKDALKNVTLTKGYF